MGLRAFLASVHEGKFTPGKYGEWRFDKRSYSTIPPPRHLGNPPPGIENELVSANLSCSRVTFSSHPAQLLCMHLCSI